MKGIFHERMGVTVREKLLLKDFEQLKVLLNEYKRAIHEDELTEDQFVALREAIEKDRITFYVATVESEIVAMCSITTAFSTFNCKQMGIFEDFYIKPTHRGTGVASKLVEFVFSELEKQDITSVWVGSADIDVEMYKHLGFNIPLGNLLAWCK